MSNLSTLYGIWEVKALSRFPQEALALEILQKVAAQVYHLCLEKKFKVYKLEEFFPVHKGLQGMNVNRTTIYLRLRHPHDKNIFLPWIDILGTALHELVHMVIGHHNARFYAELDNYWNIIETIQDKGITGDDPVHQNGVWMPKNSISSSGKSSNRTVAFTSHGNRLGGSTTMGSSTNSTNFHGGANSRTLRNKMLQAVEQRLKRAKIMGKTGGEKLGSSSSIVSDHSTHQHSHHNHPSSSSDGCASSFPTSTFLPHQREDKRQLFAWAAEQRLHDSYACGNSQDQVTVTTHDEISTHTLTGSSSSTVGNNTTNKENSTTASSSSSSSSTVTNTVIQPSAIVDVIIIDDNNDEIIQFIERPVVIHHPPHENEEEEEEEDDDDSIIIFTENERTITSNTDQNNNNNNNSSSSNDDNNPSETLSSSSSSSTIIDLSLPPTDSSPVRKKKSTTTTNTATTTTTTTALHSSNITEDTYICSVCTYQGSRKGGLALACEICGNILRIGPPGPITEANNEPTSSSTITTILSRIPTLPNTADQRTSTNENIPPNLLAWKLAAEEVNQSSSSSSSKN